MLRSISISLVAITAFAQAPAPRVPAEVEAEYYRADGRVAHMKAEWDSANADLAASVAAVQKACGDKFVPSMDGKHLVCVAKPEPPKAEAKKP